MRPRRALHDPAEAQQAIVEYIGYYNTERRHSSLGNVPPAEFERRWHANAEKDRGSLAVSSTRYPPPAGFRFVASDRTGRPWITLFAPRGVRRKGTGSLGGYTLFDFAIVNTSFPRDEVPTKTGQLH